AVTCLVVALFSSPVSYLEGLRSGHGGYAHGARGPLATFVANLRSAASPAAYYWLSFSRHAQPLAPLLARPHHLLTPACLVPYAAGLVVALARRQGLALLVLYVPAAIALAFVPRGDGMWRLHLLAPLVCCAVATQAAAAPPVARAGMLLAAVLAG